MFEILNYFPNNISEILSKNIENSFDELEEIHTRAYKPIILKFSNKEIVTKYPINTEEILNILQRICENSIYSYQNQICSRIHNYKRWSQGWDNWRSCA